MAVWAGAAGRNSMQSTHCSTPRRPACPAFAIFSNVFICFKYNVDFHKAKGLRPSRGISWTAVSNWSYLRNKFDDAGGSRDC